MRSNFRVTFAYSLRGHSVSQGRYSSSNMKLLVTLYLQLGGERGGHWCSAGFLIFISPVTHGKTLPIVRVGLSSSITCL